MFTETYLLTTDPKKSLPDFFRGKLFFMILGSVVFHTIVYILFFNLVHYIFMGKLLSSFVNTRLFYAALIIMSLGYIARYYHVKDIYHSYNKNMTLTRNHCDKLFISWLFIS
jgi:hypothetical protein